MSSLNKPWAPAYPIRTDRLILRPHLETDLDDLVPFHSDPEVTRYIPWPVRNREETRTALAARLAKGTAIDEGDWLILAVVIAAENRVIGEVLLKRENEAEGVGELGYVIARSHQGQGLATEAARAMLALAFGEFGLKRVTARIDEPNAASRAMVERLGFAEDSRFGPDTAQGETEVLLHYSLIKDAATR
ncbi:MAG: GNAT family N-acetyltransferase [Homoserinimonas sp.]